MTPEPSRDVEARLADLLVRVIDWLKFAEAKNTAAVGLSTTALGVIVTFLVAGPPVPELAGTGLSFGAVLLMVSLLLAVASFLPSTNLEKHLRAHERSPPPRTTSSSMAISRATSREPWSALSRPTTTASRAMR